MAMRDEAKVKTAIETNISKLCDDTVSILPILTYLRAKGCLLETQIDEIMSNATDYSRNNAMYNLVIKKTDMFPHLLGALRKYANTGLASLLEKTYLEVLTDTTDAVVSVRATQSLSEVRPSSSSVAVSEGSTNISIQVSESTMNHNFSHWNINQK